MDKPGGNVEKRRLRGPMLQSMVQHSEFQKVIIKLHTDIQRLLNTSYKYDIPEGVPETQEVFGSIVLGEVPSNEISKICLKCEEIEEYVREMTSRITSEPAGERKEKLLANLKDVTQGIDTIQGEIKADEYLFQSFDMGLTASQKHYLLEAYTKRIISQGVVK